MPARGKGKTKPHVLPMTQVDIVAVEAAGGIAAAYPKLGPQQLEWVRDGEVVVYEGRDPEKPVLRWGPNNNLGKRAGMLVPGSGVSPNHADRQNSLRSSIKRTNEYVALTQRILDPGDGGGFEEVLVATRDSALGVEKDTKVSCPECGHDFVWSIKFPGDPRAQKILIEAMIPTKKTEIDANVSVTQQQLSVLVEMTPSEMASIFRPGLAEEEIKERREYIEVRSEEANNARS